MNTGAPLTFSSVRKATPSVFLGFLLWTSIGLVFALSRTGTGQNAKEIILAALIEWWTWGLLTPLIVSLDRRLPFYGSRSLLHLVMHMFLGPIWILLFSFSSESICWALGLQQWGHLFANYRQAFFWTMLIYLLIVGVSEADLFRQKNLSAELQVQRLGKNLADARLQTLRMQLNPHFLFNALNTISAELTDDPKLARRMIEHLGDLLRSSIELRDRQEVTLDEELEVLEHFVAIQKVRFGDCLNIRIDVPSKLRSALVPSLLLQPLVENAIRHGIAEQIEGGTVSISATNDQGYLTVSVEDDGVGLPTGWTLVDQPGLGLNLTRERIKNLYPDTRAELRVHRREPRGTSIEVLLPHRASECTK